MEKLDFLILEQDENKRIDAFLSTKLSDMSRNRIQKLIEDDKININGKSVNKNYKLKNNDFLEIYLEEPKEIDIKAENIYIDIIYEDDDIIVVNKPQNMVVHPAVGNYQGTLVNALMYHCKDSLSSINGVLRPGIVHRIDKDTSGILVIAKNDNSHNKLAEQLASHSMTRTYYAIVTGNLKQDTGTIDAPIGRNKLDRKKMAVTIKNSKRAVTHYTVLERFDKYTFVKLNLETGRTHQIRVHMAYIGHPLLGDYVYGLKKQKYNLLGQALHAKELGFIHPTKNEYIQFGTDLPEYFTNLLENFRKSRGK